jgi:hypothetical protein
MSTVILGVEMALPETRLDRYFDRDRLKEELVTYQEVRKISSDLSSGLYAPRLVQPSPHHLSVASFS